MQLGYSYELVCKYKDSLRNTHTKRIKLTAENIIDIQCALRRQKDGKIDDPGLGECFEETCEKILVVEVPEFDY